MNYEFTVILGNVKEMTADLADALFSAGCDDGHPWSSGGVAAITFDREADSLVSAIQSAAADVEKARCSVKEVRVGPDLAQTGHGGAASC
jgi:hypothetical protein